MCVKNKFETEVSLRNSYCDTNKSVRRYFTSYQQNCSILHRSSLTRNQGKIQMSQCNSPNLVRLLEQTIAIF